MDKRRVSSSMVVLNGYHFRMERELVVELIVDIAKGLYTLEITAHILKEHSEER